jgi:carbamate kinase
LTQRGLRDEKKFAMQKRTDTLWKGDRMESEKKTVVVALGGNAILQPGQQGTFDEQMSNVHVTCEQLAHMVESGKYRIVVTHGNGPQVGNLLLQNEAGKDVAAPMPLFVCGAESQGLIGLMMQQNLGNLLAAQGNGDIPVATVITQVVVDKNDQAFVNPTKPVGPFYSEEEAKALESEKGYDVREDAGRGWRRVVPSPDPIEIYEKEAIRHLVEARAIVIASGGGGIPVIREDGKLVGVDAVIDKDLAGERLAVDVGASIFMVLTDVDSVRLNYKTPDERTLSSMTVAEAKQYAEEGHFAKGSMEPKVRAAVRFVEAGGEKAIITSLNQAVAALEGRAGTTITKN